MFGHTIDNTRLKLLFEALITYSIFTALMILGAYNKQWWLLILSGVALFEISILFACVLIRDTFIEVIEQSETKITVVPTIVSNNEDKKEDTVEEHITVQ